jgi:hypothetical protein
MKNKILQDLSQILDKIPFDTGLTEEEVKLEMATRIVEHLALPVSDQVPDADLAGQRQELFDSMTEFGVYFSGTTHPTDLVER